MWGKRQVVDNVGTVLLLSAQNNARARAREHTYTLMLRRIGTVEVRIVRERVGVVLRAKKPELQWREAKQTAAKDVL